MSPDGQRRFDAMLADLGQLLLAAWRAERNAEDVRAKLEQMEASEQPSK